MIASFQNNFIFIKTEKTAGTSIEVALTPYCGPADILTPVVLADERLRLIDGQVAARNYAPRDPRLEAAFRNAVQMGDESAARRVLDALRTGPGFYNHMTATEAAARLPADFWRRAFKFTIVRHPYERAVSGVYFVGGSAMTAAEFDATFERIFPALGIDHLRYTRDGKLVVDDVIRHETIQGDLNRILARLNLAPVSALPQAKSGHRRDRRPAREILSRPQRRRLQQLCAVEFELFDYAP